MTAKSNSFITNEGQNTLLNEFNLLLKDTEFFDCLVGYFYVSGFHKLQKSLEHLSAEKFYLDSHAKIFEVIKDLDSNVKTIYVMSIGIGDLLKLDKADGYSLEATNVTKKLVKKLHNNGKEVYAWTVNTEDNINKMIDLNVDNIITDNIELGQTLVEESKTMNILTIYESLLEKVF